ncbi:MAG TPA: hypothetical protein VD815_04800 [Candidatus Saccharimonadales bacterium]|nr:hypothetical protein [Candidatus Saccharimonadales bacterium]
MSRMLSDCFHKNHNSIKVKSRCDPELMLSTVMSLLIEQSNEIKRLGSLTKSKHN